MAHSSKNDDAISLLEAALDACKKHQFERCKTIFEKFHLALSEYRLGPDHQISQDETSSEKGSERENFPVESIPLKLYALADCLISQSRHQEVEEFISKILFLVTTDHRLAFLRQNIYQEAARFYVHIKKHDLADELFSKQLAIVKLKGSKVLTDFVKINLLINQGDLAASRNDLIKAELKYSQALLLIESQWKPSEEHLDWLFASIRRL